MDTKPSGTTLALPVDGLVLLRLHGKACIVCGVDDVELLPAGHWYTPGREPGSLLGWAVVACPVHAGVRG